MKHQKKSFRKLNVQKKILPKKNSASFLSKIFLGSLIFVLVFPMGRIWSAFAENAPSDQTSSTTSAAEIVTYPYQKTFIISAYYSPLPQQKKYVTGSYDGDVRLNGAGVHGADGSAVYPGMVAAPSTYAFGIKMKIPGVGVVAVHDRGGAIVHAGERNQAYDRLDLWMGYGDAGLKRALDWGRKVLEVTVYGQDPNLQESVTLPGYSDDEKYSIGLPTASTSDQTSDQSSPNSSTDVTPSQPPLFPNDLSFGDQGEQVGDLQKDLQELHYYDGSLTQNFDALTQQALLRFQIQSQIVDDGSDFGAGYFGPQTRRALEIAVKNHQMAPSSLSATSGQVDAATIAVTSVNAKIDENKPSDVLAARLTVTSVATETEQVQISDTFDHELFFGEKSNQVKLLQIELKKVNLLAIEPNGYFGETTRHALFKFQQSESIVTDEQSVGAGIFGPATRKRLNMLVAARVRTQALLSSQQNQHTAQLAVKN